jgi:hypothetical protein
MDLGHGLASIRKQDIDESQFEIGTGIRITRQSAGYVGVDSLLNEEESWRAIELIAASEDVQEQDPLTLQLKDAFARLDKQALEPALKEVLEIPTVKLWRAILDTETESYPNIEVSGRWSRLQMLMESFFSLTLQTLTHLALSEVVMKSKPYRSIRKVLSDL